MLLIAQRRIPIWGNSNEINDRVKDARLYKSFSQNSSQHEHIPFLFRVKKTRKIRLFDTTEHEKLK